jgi:hypothetical protein
MKKMCVILLIIIFIIPNIAISQTSIFQELTEEVDAGADVKTRTSTGGSRRETADMDLRVGAAGSVSVDASCDNIDFNYSMDNYLTKFNEVISSAKDIGNVEAKNQAINLAVLPIAFVMCQLNMDAYSSFEDFTKAIDGAVKTATKMVEGLTNFFEQTKMGGSPTLRRSLFSIPANISKTLGDLRKGGEEGSAKAENLSDCISRQTVEIRKIIDELANRNFSFNVSSHLNLKEECILDKAYRSHDLGGAFEDLLKGSNIEGVDQGVYCFVDGTCVQDNSGLPEIEIKMPYGLTYPTGKEYQTIVKNSIRTWLNKAETMDVNPFAYLVIANKLNNLLADKYDMNNLNVYKNDFLVDLQNIIKYSINSSVACIKSNFILFQPNDNKNYKLQLVDKVIECLNINFFTDPEYYITKDNLIMAHRYLNAKKLSGDAYNISNFSNIPEQGASVSKSASISKNVGKDVLSDESIYYSLYSAYVAAIYTSIKSYGISYKPHVFKLFRDIGNSLFVIYDDFYGELEKLQSEKMVLASHNMNKKILAVAQRENLALEKKELIDKLLEQKYYDNIKVEKAYYTGKY